MLDAVAAESIGELLRDCFQKFARADAIFRPHEHGKSALSEGLSTTRVGADDTVDFFVCFVLGWLGLLQPTFMRVCSLHDAISNGSSPLLFG